MNYIRHLGGFFIKLAGDRRMTPYHISLYFALFRQWNAVRFRDRFVISRAEMMELARIGSANTYARCMKELAEWGYIRYAASSNIHQGSRVSCIRFDSSANDAEDNSGIESDTAGNNIPGTDDPAGIKTSTGAGTARYISGDTGIKIDTASDTGSDTTGDTSTSGSLKSDTTGDTTTNTGIETDTATGTGDDTGTSWGIKSDTASSTARDTGITTGRKTDTTGNAANDENDPAGIKSGTGTDTASDTLLINDINKNKLKENKERIKKEKKENPKEKEKTRERKENSETGPEEETEIPDFSEVVFFFDQNRFPQSEAQKFYSRYQSTGWKTGDMQKILSWQALARKWMMNSKKMNSYERPFNPIGAGRFSVPVIKDYSEPL